MRALNPLETDLVVLEVASAVPAGVLELLLLATRCVRQGTVAKADYPPTLAESGSPGGKGAILPQMRAQRHMHPRSAPQESSLGEPQTYQFKRKRARERGRHGSHIASARERHCNGTEESSSREENAREEARGAGLHLYRYQGSDEHATCMVRALPERPSFSH